MCVPRHCRIYRTEKIAKHGNCSIKKSVSVMMSEDHARSGADDEENKLYSPLLHEFSILVGGVEFLPH